MESKNPFDNPHLGLVVLYVVPSTDSKSPFHEYAKSTFCLHVAVFLWGSVYFMSPSLLIDAICVFLTRKLVFQSFTYSYFACFKSDPVYWTTLISSRWSCLIVSSYIIFTHLKWRLHFKANKKTFRLHIAVFYVFMFHLHIL